MVELYQRPRSPYWYAYIQDPRQPDGIRRLSTKQRSESAARKIARSLQEEVDAELEAEAATAAPGLTWSEAILRHAELATLKDSTRASNAYLASVVTRELGDFHLNHLSHDMLRRFCQKRRQQVVQPPGAKASEKRVTDATIRRSLSYISSVYATLIAHDVEGAPQENPAKTFDRSFLKDSPKVDNHLRSTQFIDALSCLKKPHHRAVLITLVGTGMRESELRQLRWEEIDWDQQIIEFGNLDSDRTKTSRSRRIPLLAPVAAVLRTQRSTLEKRKRYHPKGYVFPNPTSTADEQMPMQDFAYVRKAVQDRTGIKGFKIHGLRHTFASWALQQGVDAKAIQGVLGHTTLSTTDRYAHHIDDSMLTLLRKLDLRLPAHFTAHSTGHITPGDIAEQENANASEG